MIAKKNRSIRYFTRQDIADIHADLSEQVLSDGGEPLPDFRYGKQEAIDALIAAPQQRFGYNLLRGQPTAHISEWK